MAGMEIWCPQKKNHRTMAKRNQVLDQKSENLFLGSSLLQYYLEKRNKALFYKH